jgi:hypothetical protein
MSGAWPAPSSQQVPVNQGLMLVDITTIPNGATPGNRARSRATRCCHPLLTACTCPAPPPAEQACHIFRSAAIAALRGHIQDSSALQKRPEPMPHLHVVSEEACALQQRDRLLAREVV